MLLWEIRGCLGRGRNREERYHGSLSDPHQRQECKSRRRERRDDLQAGFGLISSYEKNGSAKPLPQRGISKSLSLSPFHAFVVFLFYEDPYQEPQQHTKV